MVSDNKIFQVFSILFYVKHAIPKGGPVVYIGP